MNLASCHLACSLHPCAAFICLQGEHPLSHSNSTQTLYHCALYTSARRANTRTEPKFNSCGIWPTVCWFVIPTAFVQPDHAWRTKGHRWLFKPVVYTCGGERNVSITHMKHLLASYDWMFLKWNSVCTLGLISLWTSSELTFLVHPAPLE